MCAKKTCVKVVVDCKRGVVSCRWVCDRPARSTRMTTTWSNRTAEWELMEMQLWFMHVSVLVFVVCIVCLARRTPPADDYVVHLSP